MSLLQEIQSKCTPAEIAEGNFHAIAAKVSSGRKVKRPFLAGKGDVIIALGLDVGNAVCDVVDTAPVYRHVKHLLTEGRLDVSLPLTAMMLGSLVGQPIAAGITFTQEHANTLLALAEVEAPVSWTECATALGA